MEEITGLSVKDALSAPSLGWKTLNSMTDASDETIYTYSDIYLKHYVGQNIKGGRVCAFNQCFMSEICGDVLKMLSRELKVEGNVYDVIEAYMKYKNNLLIFIKKEYGSKFDE